MATRLSSITNELQLLHLLIDTPTRLLDLKGNYFISVEGKDMYTTLNELYIKQVSPSMKNIIGVGNTLNEEITPELYNAIITSEYDKNAFDHYYSLLRAAYAQEHIQAKVLQSITKATTTKGLLDLPYLESLVGELQDDINLAKDNITEIRTTQELFSSYKDTIKKRSEGTEYPTTGCSKLNSALSTGFAPGEITTIFGSTGVGKSTYSLYLINRLVNLGIPTLYISLEMSETATMDRWLASRLRMPLKELVGTPTEPIDESVLKLIELEQEKLLKRKRFAILDSSSMSILDVEKAINQFKLKSESNYSVVFIDLATMLQEFSKGESRDYERAMNLIHQVAKRTNTHIVLVVQAVQKSLEKYRPRDLKGIEIFRPSLASIKNSSAIAERSRIVLSVFRAKYYATRFFPENPNIDILDDVVEVQVLKQSNGQVGQVVQYIHNEGMFRFFSFPDDYEPTTIKTIDSFGEIDIEDDDEI